VAELVVTRGGSIYEKVLGEVMLPHPQGVQKDNVGIEPVFYGKWLSWWLLEEVAFMKRC
jgi:hypothetical protein